MTLMVPVPPVFALLVDDRLASRAAWSSSGFSGVGFSGSRLGGLVGMAVSWEKGKEPDQVVDPDEEKESEQEWGVTGAIFANLALHDVFIDKNDDRFHGRAKVEFQVILN